MYPVYETDLSVRTEIEELPPLPEFPTARISEFVAQLEKLMGRMNPSSYGPTEPHLWLVGKTPPRTWENCKETSERKSRTHSYDELVDLLIELAMERENDSHMDKYLRKHLRREAPAEKPQGGRSPQPHSNPGKGKGVQLKHMTETPPAKGKRAPNKGNKGGPCHAPDCDGRSSCMLQLRRTQKTKDGQEVKDQDHFRCTITCGYCGKRRHYEDECHIKRRESEKLKKAEEERRKNAGKGGWVGLGEGLTWSPTHGPRCLPCRTRPGGCTRVSGHKAYRTADRPQTPRWRSRAGDAAAPVCMCPCVFVEGGGGGAVAHLLAPLLFGVGAHGAGKCVPGAPGPGREAGEPDSEPAGGDVGLGSQPPRH